jgi:DNA-binding NtrC family response regulator
MESPRQTTIVVIGERHAVLELIDQALRSAGHNVLVTTQPREAIEVASQVVVDVLIADGAVLEGSDSSLMRKLQLAQPGIRILDLQSLASPFSLAQLNEDVEELLGGRPRPARDSRPGRLASARRS